MKLCLLRLRGVVVCCPNCGKGMGLTGVTRFVGVGGLVYSAWDDSGDDDCW